MPDDALLPFIDAYSVDIEAPARDVWDAVLALSPGAHPSIALRAFAWAWAADPAASNGLGSHVLGAERPGFAVCEVVPPATYALAGRHRFARYQLVFRIEQRGPGRSRLIAETFAVFPGWKGRLYRAALLDARLHAMVMWIMVRLVRRRAEALACKRDKIDA
ncbi:hypothetical protein TBR22_A04920 [Luteitalea sp. TBR-22]|uniref:SRPBCC family protein n=1 Tax=Luteitalea sp. TBR-22 TaxID=2802971 RepID=UPI001AF247EC|nr:SRPBCC family protein [Luteitalea sp. TBR-22]BCS31292.1 hypothetical protein TBR22_A04920 [Luteitalea sp. TBR-22]